MRPFYMPIMRAFACIALAVIILGSASAVAQDLRRQREINALRDSARAQERQADELRRLRQIESDRVDAKRDARSIRRSERPWSMPLADSRMRPLTDAWQIMIIPQS